MTDPIDLLTFMAASRRGRLAAQLQAHIQEDRTMRITITLHTDNAAFTDHVRNPLDGQSAEILRILQEWTARGARPGPLRDVNGNTVGQARITGR